MPINKDYDNPHPSRIALHDENAKLDRSFEGPVAMITLGKEQYLASGTQRRVREPDGPVARSTLSAGTDLYILPRASMTVLRGKVGPAQ